MKLILHLSICLLTLPNWCGAQPALSLTFDHPVIFGSENGLPSDQVNTLLKDRSGFIWVGTGEGLARFDGHQFEVEFGTLLTRDEAMKVGRRIFTRLMGLCDALDETGDSG